MIPDKTSAIALFSAPYQYVIPVFQRGYVWTLEKQVAPLWADIEDRVSAWLDRQEILRARPSAQLTPLRKHFLGSVVLTPITSIFGRVRSYEVIDGQQRTTTLHILLLAFRHASNKLEDNQISKMLDALIKNDGAYSLPTDSHKVWPTKAGRDEISFLDRALDVEAVNSEYPAITGKQRHERPLMVQAYLYLYHAILAFLANTSMDDPQSDVSESTLSDGLIHSIRKDNAPKIGKELSSFSALRAQALYMALQDAVQIMTLTLESEDDPQVIFETLNARGAPLLSSDLIRNFVFLEAARTDLSVGVLYDTYWQGFDEQSDQNEKITANRYWREKERSGRITHPRIDLFFYYYTILRRKQETKVAHVFQGFKEWWQQEQRDIDCELKIIVTTSKYFKELVSPEGTGELVEFARLIKVLDVSTVIPVYLFLRERYRDGDPCLTRAIKDLSSYLTRRAVCGFTTKSYNRTFLRLLEEISRPEVAEPADELRSFLLHLNGHSQCWPNDQEFREHWLSRPVYKELRPAKTAAILRALEVHGRTSWQELDIVVPIDKLTVEHVLPQGWEKTSNYPLPVESDESRLRRNQLLNTFGNLTLLTQGLNSSVSHGAFCDSTDDSGGLVEGKRAKICRQSILKMNAYFQNQKKWSEPEILLRADSLFIDAIKIWSLPI